MRPQSAGRFPSRATRAHRNGPTITTSQRPRVVRSSRSARGRLADSNARFAARVFQTCFISISAMAFSARACRRSTSMRCSALPPRSSWAAWSRAWSPRFCGYGRNTPTSHLVWTAFDRLFAAALNPINLCNKTESGQSCFAGLPAAGGPLSWRRQLPDRRVTCPSPNGLADPQIRNRARARRQEGRGKNLWCMTC